MKPLLLAAALMLAAGSAHAQYTMQPYGQGGAIFAPSSGGATRGYGFDAPQQPYFTTPNAYAPPGQQHWQQFSPGYGQTHGYGR
jgi:hypothetical protein